MNSCGLAMNGGLAIKDGGMDLKWGCNGEGMDIELGCHGDVMRMVLTQNMKSGRNIGIENKYHVKSRAKGLFILFMSAGIAGMLAS